MKQPLNILGTGPTIHKYNEWRGQSTPIAFGVNMAIRFAPCDVLVTLDTVVDHPPDEVEDIKNANILVLFSRTYDFDWHPKYREIGVWRWPRGDLSTLDDPNQVSLSSTSMFSATILGWHYLTGAIVIPGLAPLKTKEIVIWGCDLTTDHKLFPYKGQILEHFAQLRKALLLRGYNLFTGSDESGLYEVLPAYLNK